MIGRGDLGTKKKFGVSSTLFVIGSVARSAVRSFVRPFHRILFYFILFLPNYKVCSSWFCTHEEGEKIFVFFFFFYLHIQSQSN